MLNYQKIINNIMPEEPVYHLRFVLKPLKLAPDYASVYIRLEYGGEFVDFGVTGVKVKKQGFSNYIPMKAIEVREAIREKMLVGPILKIKELIHNNHPSNAKIIKMLYNGNAIECATIINLMEKCIKECPDIQNINTQKCWRSKVSTLKEYLLLNKKTKMMAIDFTPVETNNYIAYLKNKGLMDSSIKVHKDKIGKAITWGFSTGVIKTNTLSGFKAYGLKAHKPNPSPLEWEFIESIENFYFEEDIMKRARDMFVFCCYIGASYSDLKELTNEANLWEESIINEHNERIKEYYVKGVRGKGTDEKQNIAKTYKVKLWGNALVILKQYGCLSKICTIDNSDVNKRIKHCFERIGISPEVARKITFHKSRHTFSSYLKHVKKQSNEKIMEQTGHSSEKSLRYYIPVRFKDSLVRYKGGDFKG